MSTPTDHERELRAETLKERVYLSFAALAVVIAMTSYEGVEAGEVATTLVLTVLGMLLAMLIAEMISHLVRHEALPTRIESLHMLNVTFGSLGAVIIPFALLTASALTGWNVHSALRWSIAWLVLSLVISSYLAVHKLRITPLQKSIVLGAEATLGLVVIALKLLAYG